MDVDDMETEEYTPDGAFPQAEASCSVGAINLIPVTLATARN